MKLKNLERHFGNYLDEHWSLSNITPFLLVYIHLLFWFKAEIPKSQLKVLLERQKQLCGQEFDDQHFEELRNDSRSELNKNLGHTDHLSKESMLNRLVFAVLLDTEESDFFYLTEPMFEFVRIMDIPADQFGKMLEMEFAGFKI